MGMAGKNTHCLCRRLSALLVLLVMLLGMLPGTGLASTQTGTVNCSSLNLRSEATKNSKALQTLEKGDEVIILDTSGDWYKVIYGKYTGYVMKKYINAGSSSSKSTNSNAKNSDSSSDSSASTILAKLKKIGKPTACEYGTNGNNVKKLQKCLQACGFYSGSIDGDYGPATRSAVKLLQKNKGLKQTGNADSATIAAMFGEKASTTTTSGKGNNSKTIETERLNWFKNGQDRIPKGATFVVKDCKTGKTFECKRWSGSNHLDAEPLTKSDTAILKAIYGGWSWKRRPILVKYNGRVYAASMNGMPHGTSTIDNNKFDGHFCIHFYKSKTHGTKKVDSTHQNCVATAMNYTW